MLAVKSIFLSAIYILFLALFINSNNENEINPTIRGNVVDNFSIEGVLHDRSGPLLSANTESLKLRSSWTYEKGPGLSPAGSEMRNYGRVFFKDRSRFICWEIILEHKSLSDSRDLNFSFSLFDQKGNEINRSRVDSWIPSNAEFSDHGACWGLAYAGNWEIGDYYFVIKPETAEARMLNDFETYIKFRIR